VTGFQDISDTTNLPTSINPVTDRPIQQILNLGIVYQTYGAGVARRTQNNADFCLYRMRTSSVVPNTCVDNTNCKFWDVFDVFDKTYLRDHSDRFGDIPADLRGMVDEIF
jgi:hypothetical protein